MAHRTVVVHIGTDTTSRGVAARLTGEGDVADAVLHHRGTARTGEDTARARAVFVLHRTRGDEVLHRCTIQIAEEG